MTSAAFSATMRQDAVDSRWHLRSESGDLLPLPVERWHGQAAAEEEDVLDRAKDAALDIGCGPGRHSMALAERGVRTLGIDTASAAVRTARARGARAVVRSIFDPLPGGWGSALLLDGNIGIGGNPELLLKRIGSLLREDGRILVEVEAPGSRAGCMRVRIEENGRPLDAWFDWATVDAEGLIPLAKRAGFSVNEMFARGGRWFATLDKP